MKIYISDISADLKAMTGLLGRGNEATAFQFFHFAFQEKTLEVTAANLGSGVTRGFPAQVETPVTLLVPPGFIDVIAGLGDVIALTITADEIRVQAGAFDGTVKCLAADDYPQLPTTQLERPITITPAAFNQLLGVSPYADPAASPALEGVLFSWKTYDKGHMKMSTRAASTAALALTTVAARGENEAGEALVTSTSINALKVLLRAATTDIEIFKGQGHLVFKSTAVTAWIGLLSISYPDFGPLFARQFACPACSRRGNLPQQALKTVTCQHCQQETPIDQLVFPKHVSGVTETGTLSTGLAKAIRHIAIGNGENGSKVTASAYNAIFAVQPGQIALTYHTGASQPSTYVFPFNTDDEPDLQIGFNLHILEKAVHGIENVIGGQAITLGFTDEKGQLVLRAQTSEGPFIAVAMPVAL
ncbi:MAG: hypothetical protein JXB38_02595 [Anaerolineales bacterium]|nr:hypothetical protein [Anaerolineales bacterium]